MTTSAEVVRNKALSGDELRAILREDFERLIMGDAMLADHVAYGRISYRVQYTLHVDNPMFSESNTFIDSRPVSGQLLEADEAYGAIEGKPPLLDPSPDAAVHSLSLDRDITRPNAERLRTGQPIPILRTRADGMHIEEVVHYPRPEGAEADPGAVHVLNTDAEARKSLGMPALPDAAPVGVEPEKPESST
jgi:hypothetical protein